ncbi:MAG TPA: hypothetical protein VGN42_05480 [Pirellulales bacterium]|nr:hypothetical protein [Pirellulales bacterium]
MNLGTAMHGRSAMGKASALAAVWGALACCAAGWPSQVEAGGPGGASATGAPQVRKSIAASRGEWHYVYRDGRWWCWLPSKHAWAYYDGQGWKPYRDARSLASASPARHAKHEVLQVRYAYDPPANRAPSRYRLGEAPSPPTAAIEDLRAGLAEVRQSVRQLESRMTAQEHAARAGAPLPGVQAAELSELWRARQADQRFYDFGSDGYYFNGRGHFVD